MPFFRYEAVDRTGKIVSGSMDAADEAVVRMRLTQRGFRVQTVEPPQALPRARTATATAARTAAPKLGGGLKRAGARECALFYRQFAAQVRAGITLYQALDTIAPRTHQPSLHRAVTEMADAARTGGHVSDVMERHPRLFPDHIVGAVRAGETGGFIEIVLDEIALEYEQELAFYKNTALMRWLLIQQAVAIAVAQPVFPAIFPNNNLGLYVRLLLFRNLPIVALLILLVPVLWRQGQEPRFRRTRDALSLRVPTFGNLARQRALAAFIRSLRRLYAAGIPPSSAWQGAAAVVPNTVIRERLAEAYQMMQQNVPLHDAFAATHLFSDEAEQLLATGVVSGQVVEMLDRIADYYQDNVDRAFASARFWMFRLSSALFIAMMGVVLIMFTKNYFAAVFEAAGMSPP